MSSQIVNRYEVPLWRILLMYAIIIGVVGLVLYRLLFLQVLGQGAWLGQAVDNYEDTILDPAPRGIIYDRNGFILMKKRLEAGTFRLARKPLPEATHVEIDSAELALMLEGIELDGAKRRKRYRHDPT